MSNPYIGEIRMFGGNFPPNGWAFCDGQLIPISENDAMFTLIGTTYGGDGQETFALPDLQGRIPVHVGPGFVLAQKDGTESVTLTTQQIPVHSHAPFCSNAAGTGANPAGNVWAVATTGNQMYFQMPSPTPQNPPPLVQMDATAITPTGGSQPHDNMAPFLVINFIISLFGIFPQQS
ncbi:MAG TPA: tail fiber protein [Pyrinomonadaceae bacterium]|jgi:microcystin-dependent protein